MKYLVLFLLLFLTLFSDSNAQGRVLTGEVVDVIDGRTFTLESSRARFTVQLQFVDTPESTQQLYDTVKGHLSSLLKNKHVTVQMRHISGSVYVGKVILDGVDLSMQLLRDGAAWYSVPEAQFQPDQERSEYLDIENLAKAEKRGVWGVADIRPAYELRLAREKVEKERLDKAWKEFLASAAAMAKYESPVIRMHYFAFKRLCEPSSESGDYTSRSDFTWGTTMHESLAVTDERKKNGCWGSFSFDENFRLRSMSQSTRVK